MTTPILDTLHFSVNGPPRHATNCAELPVNDLGTIVSLVARGIGVAAVPRLALALGERRVAVRELPEPVPFRDVYAVARAASVRRPSVAVVLAALATGVRRRAR